MLLPDSMFGINPHVLPRSNYLCFFNIRFFKVNSTLAGIFIRHSHILRTNGYGAPFFFCASLGGTWLGLQYGKKNLYSSQELALV